MKGMILATLSVLLSVLLTGIMAMPLCFENSENNECKTQGTFFEVDCMEQLKFKHSKASCFMNNKDEFIILALNDRKLYKRSLATEVDVYAGAYGGRVRIQRSSGTEEDFKAEVLSSKELKDLLNKQKDLNTENPLTTNEVSPAKDEGSTYGEPGETTPIVGLIFVVATTANSEENNDVTTSNESTPSVNLNEDMAEALFGLMLLGAIMEEVKKHQIEKASSDAN